MALAHSMLTSPSCCCCYRNPQRNSSSRVVISLSATRNYGIYSVPRVCFPLNLSSKRRKEVSVSSRGRLNVTDLQTAGENNGQIRSGVEIPVTCYQIIGVTPKAEKDEIVKSVMDLKSAEVEEGYTLEAVVSRQDLLMDVRDKLLFEPEYAGNIREKIPPKSSLRIPWSWLPGALCLLQEVGEETRVLEIGGAALQHADAKPFIHDLVLSMALAECATAKIGFEKNKVSQGFEALARAQFLLRSKNSLGKLSLLSQIEESLEELAPACTLELLGMPHTPENAERRRGAIAALQELLRQGLDVETTCRVQDWPCFLSQALRKLMATEIIDLLPWDDLVATRKNKKSLESQNQRVVIDFNCFYITMIAHIAIGFSSKQTELINKAKTICECLVASEGIDLKFEEALCSFLLGQGNEAAAADQLRELEINSGTATRSIVSSVPENEKNGSSLSLEMWLKESVLGLFSDTRDCPPSLANFFAGEKRNFRSKQTKGAPKTLPAVSYRPPSFVLSTNNGGSEEPLPYLNSTRHLGVAVKQLAPTDLQSPLMAGRASGDSSTTAPSVQLKRSLGAHHKNGWGDWGDWSVRVKMVEKITFFTVVGCIVFTTVKLLGMQFGHVLGRSRWDTTNLKTDRSTLSWTIDSSLNQKAGPAFNHQSSIGGRIRNLLMMFAKVKNHPDERSLQSSAADDLFPFSKALHKSQMPMEEADALVRKWQAVKAEALGPDHDVQGLPEVLADSMLAQWQDLAAAAKTRSCFWRFVLLHLSILHAEIMSDGTGEVIAEIEALLEEAAELVDESKPKNPTYYSSYKIQYILKRQGDGSWRFCGWEIENPT